MVRGTWCVVSPRLLLVAPAHVSRTTHAPATHQVVPFGSPGAHPVPRAHTCANQLHLPEYTSREALRKGLLLALELEADGAFHEWGT
jgi:hypothetical protein